jgi:hypothetical protein
VEVVMPVECEIPLLKISSELPPDMIDLETCIFYLEKLDEQHRDVSTMNETHKKCVKSQYDKLICPRTVF